MNRLPDSLVADELFSSLSREMTSCSQEWRAGLEALKGNVADHAQGVRMTELAHRTRGLARVLDLPLSELCALCTEVLLAAHAPVNPLSMERYELVRRAGNCLDQILAAPLSREASTVKIERALRRELFDSIGNLAAELHGAFTNPEYDPWRKFPVARMERPEPEELHVRGFDVWRMQQESLLLYVLEYSIEDVMERGSSFGIVAGLLGRSGSVFDMRFTFDEAAPGSSCGVLRVVFGSTFEQTFVEGLARLHPNCVHAVNMDALLSGAPSWEGALDFTATCLLSEPRRGVDDLMAAYDESLQTMFLETKAPPPPAEAADDEDDPLLAAFEAALARQRDEGDGS